jgi:acetyltransferase-like isoleucine patch superfamily enzyme
MIYEDKDKGIFIKADQINIGENVSLGNNLTVRAHGKFTLGNYSKLGDNTLIEGNNIIIGEHFYGSGGMNVGAGGQQHPNANLIIGDRCVIHNNVINICESVEIGNDVGFSGRVEIVTHGFWLSVLEGHPARFEGVKINNGVILGFSSTILMGVEIADNVTLGAHSLVTKNLERSNSIYAGAPARYIRTLQPLSEDERVKKLEKIIEEYLVVAKYQNINPSLALKYPFIEVNDFRINVENFEYEGPEDNETDNFRDFFRRWGIRIYTKRPFSTHFDL